MKFEMTQEMDFERVMKEEAIAFLESHGCEKEEAKSCVRSLLWRWCSAEDLLQTIQKGAYSLYKERMLPFKVADEITDEWYTKENPNTISLLKLVYSLHNTIYECMRETGSVWIKMEDAVQRMFSRLKLDPEKMEEITDQIRKFVQADHDYRVLVIKHNDEAEYVTAHEMQISEMAIKDWAMDLGNRYGAASKDILSMKIEREGRECLDTLDECQKEAVMMALTSGISIITGGPGTGKSYVIKTIADISRKIHPEWEVVLMASTGKAAQNLHRSSGYDANTIHCELRIVEGQSMREKFQNCMIIVDEVSMVDEYLLYQLLLKMDTRNCQIVLVGDPDQLPSIEPGAVLRDLIQLTGIPVCRLQHCHRQREESGIANAALQIRQKDYELKATDDFQIVTYRNKKMMTNQWIACYLKCAAEYGQEQVMGVVACHNGSMGEKNLNQKLQEQLNPKVEEETSYRLPDDIILRKGDPVIHDSGNRSEVRNGEIGVIEDIYKEDGTVIVSVNYGGRIVEYKDRECTNQEGMHLNCTDLKLAYVITIHKAQGSQCKCVLVGLESNCRLNTRNLLYTAITRAEEKCYLYIQGTNTLRETLEKDALDQRVTFLT